MKYYVRYLNSNRIDTNLGVPEAKVVQGMLEFDTAEAAFAAIPKRAAAFERTGARPSDYSVVCGLENPVIITTPPVSGHVRVEPDPKGISAFSTAPNPKKAYGDKKLPVHLVPPALTLGTALNMGDGAEKYGAFNWRKSKVEAMTYVGALQRHLLSYIDGEDVDPESKRGATHLGAIAACVAILMDAGNNGQLIDNRPPRGNAGDVIRRAAGVVLPDKESK